MKICIICVEKKDYAPLRIYQEGIKAGHEVYMTTWSDLLLVIKNKNFYFGDQKRSFAEFNAIIPRSPNFSIKIKGAKKIVKLGNLLRLLIEYCKDKKIAVLNDNFFVQYQSLDKIAQQFFLFRNDLPGIPSAFFPFSGTLRESFFKYPLVVKTAKGSLGAGVFKISDQKKLKSFIGENSQKGESFLMQKFYPIKSDFRVLVANGKALGVMERSSKGKEWRTNVSLGGAANSFNGRKSVSIKKLAEKVAHKMSFDYVGVDILQDKNRLHVIEVNSLAQFQGFEAAHPKVNVAKEIIEVMEKKSIKIQKSK